MKYRNWRFSSQECCTCTSTSIEPCDYCWRELCQSCADDEHDCDGEDCECGCESSGAKDEYLLQNHENKLEDRWFRMTENL